MPAAARRLQMWLYPDIIDLSLIVIYLEALSESLS